MTHSKLICPSDDSLVWREAPANRGWDRNLILDLVAERGLPDPLRAGAFLAIWGDCEVVDGSQLSDEQRDELYASALLARTRHEVKDIFLDASRRPTYLGTLVPALFIYRDDDPDDVYPRAAFDAYVGDTIWTIHDYLEKGWPTDVSE